MVQNYEYTDDLSEIKEVQGGGGLYHSEISLPVRKNGILATYGRTHCPSR